MPLASIIRPKNLNEIIGQSHLLNEQGIITKMLKNRKFVSTILWGPPGCGKTTIVRALANEAGLPFYQLNATEATVKDMRKVISSAEPDKPPFVFIDEIHRANKSQQDVLLPSVEDGTIILFGATTEKPKFAVNSTILSRCLVLEIKPLTDIESIQLIKRAKEYYITQNKDFKIAKDAAKRLISRTSGDARKLLTAIETCVEILADGQITTEHVDTAIPDKHLVFDATGNDHYDLAHCYQECIQHSDENGAIYWLAKWIESGEDPAYICRRMLITAFEDCAGNPFAQTTAMAASYTVERVGLPEGIIPMALATIEMATSKRNKSAFNAIHAAIADVRNESTIHTPAEMKAGMGHGHTHVYAILKKYVDGFVRD